ncbi:MAG: CPBP family intramembrane metalloprotease [Bacteroidales bacterium]|nr:CPBP family intramembrane metalloprotease [Bacteroidales bacterium]
MRKGIFSNIHPIGKLILALLIAFTIFFIFFILSIIVAIPIYNIGLEELQSIAGDITNIENINILKFFQIVQSLGLFVIPPFIIAWFIASRAMEFLGLVRKPLSSSILLSIIIILVGVPVINYLGEVNANMKLPSFMSGLERWMMDQENEYKILTERLLEANNLSTLLINIFMIAIIPAFGEELAFRGILQQLLSSWFKNKHVAVVITAFIFSAIHLQFYGFIPRFVLGLYLGYLFVWSGSLWLPIIAHFTNNCAAVIFYYLANKNIVNQDLEQYGTEGKSFYAVVISTAIIVMLLLIIQRKEKQRSVNA